MSCFQWEIVIINFRKVASLLVPRHSHFFSSLASTQGFRIGSLTKIDKVRS